MGTQKHPPHYMIQAAPVGKHPEWQAVGPVVADRDSAISTMTEMAKAAPGAFGPAGYQRLRVREVSSV